MSSTADTKSSNLPHPTSLTPILTPPPRFAQSVYRVRVGASSCQFNGMISRGRGGQGQREAGGVSTRGRERGGHNPYLPKSALDPTSALRMTLLRQTIPSPPWPGVLQTRLFAWFSPPQSYNQSGRTSSSIGSCKAAISVVRPHPSTP